MVEIRSPATALIDRTTKRDSTSRPESPSYWLVDPVEPSITALEIDQGRYVERAHVIGDATFTVSMPFPVELSTRGLHPA